MITMHPKDKALTFAALGATEDDSVKDTAQNVDYLIVFLRLGERGNSSGGGDNSEGDLRPIHSDKFHSWLLIDPN